MGDISLQRDTKPSQADMPLHFVNAISQPCVAIIRVYDGQVSAFHLSLLRCKADSYITPLYAIIGVVVMGM